MSKQHSNYLKFESGDDASIWGNSMYKSWLDNLTKEEFNAIKKYTGEVFYSNINDTLRGLNTFMYSNERYCNLITAALAKARTPDNIVAYRGTSKMMLGELRKLPVERLEGRIIEDKAFMSTSLIEGEIYDSNLILQMNIPKGTQGAYLGGLSFIKDEYEFLLNRGYQLFIKRVINDTSYFLKLEVDILCIS
jgi:hypothetical protein